MRRESCWGCCMYYVVESGANSVEQALGWRADWEMHSVDPQSETVLKSGRKWQSVMHGVLPGHERTWCHA